MIESSYYNESFYSTYEAGSHSSAQVVLPMVNDIVNPSSVIDVGCGVGYWLKVWKDEIGVKEIQGVEGPYVQPELLQIPKENIIFQDLKDPLQLGRKYDLVMSLEVAEHLPESHAKSFIKALTDLGDIILFSAAIEEQEGTYHINEQMPEYWSNIFMGFDFVPVDYIRPKIWGNPKVEWWYQQNIFFYVKKARLKDFPVLEKASEATDPNNLLRIHPWLFMHKVRYIKKTETISGYIRMRLYPFKKKVQALFKR